MPDTPVFDLRGHHVMLAADAARAFEVETRVLVQNISRNPDLFPQKYAFQIDEAERDDLTSRGVIPRPGRGGSRALPWVVTQKGAIRLATILKSPRAIEAADLFVDLFADVMAQLHAGQSRLSIPQPRRIAPSDRDLAQAQKLRGRIMATMDEILNTVVDPKAHTTVRDELAGLPQGTLSHVSEWLKTRKRGNDLTEAQTLLALEQVRDLTERRQSELADAAVTREGRALENLHKKINIVRDMLHLLDEVEPNQVVSLLGSLSPALPSPKDTK